MGVSEEVGFIPPAHLLMFIGWWCTIGAVGEDHGLRRQSLPKPAYTGEEDIGVGNSAPALQARARAS